MESRINVDKLAMRAFKEATSVKPDAQSITNLLTEKEQIKIGRRILIAQAILAGKTRYEVNEHIQVSPNTFAQVRRWLEKEMTQYRSAQTLKKTKYPKRNNKSKYIQPLTYEHLKRSYPAHFLLFSIIEELWKSIEK